MVSDYHRCLTAWCDTGNQYRTVVHHAAEVEATFGACNTPLTFVYWWGNLLFPHQSIRDWRKAARMFRLFVGMCTVMLCMVAFLAFAQAETILDYTVCSEKECHNDTVYGEDGQLQICIMQGQSIILQDLERKSRANLTVKKWRCSIGKRRQEA